MSDEAAPTKTYNGSCHCGKVKFTVTCAPLENTEVTECNCSICIRNGYLLIYCPKANVKFESGEKECTSYLFGPSRIAHYFCPTCGTSVYAQSVQEDFYPDYMVINVRTLEGVDVSKLKKKFADGKSL